MTVRRWLRTGANDPDSWAAAFPAPLTVQSRAGAASAQPVSRLDRRKFDAAVQNAASTPCGCRLVMHLGRRKPLDPIGVLTAMATVGARLRSSPEGLGAFLAGAPIGASMFASERTNHFKTGVYCVACRHRPVDRCRRGDTLARAEFDPDGGGFASLVTRALPVSFLTAPGCPPAHEPGTKPRRPGVARATGARTAHPHPVYGSPRARAAGDSAGSAGQRAHRGVRGARGARERREEHDEASKGLRADLRRDLRRSATCLVSTRPPFLPDRFRPLTYNIEAAGFAARRAVVARSARPLPPGPLSAASGLSTPRTLPRSSPADVTMCGTALAASVEQGTARPSLIPHDIAG